MQFEEEHNWLVTHSKDLEKHRGKWIAIHKNKLVASDKELKTVHGKAGSKALYFLVPRKGEENYVLWERY